MKTYAGIGSRGTPSEVLHFMRTVGAVLAGQGWVLRSGHASGADQAFERGCLRGNGQAEIYLPWDGFEGARASTQSDNGNMQYLVPAWAPNYAQAEKLAEQFHPAWHNCTTAARKLHTRNMYQILGTSLEEPVDLVICWTREGRGEWSIDQAIRLAKHLNVPIFDLALGTEALFKFFE